MKDKRLGIIFLTVFMDLVGFGIIIPLNPYLAKHFGASPLEVGLLMSVYSLMQFIFAPIWGQLSDRYGRRPIILVSLLGSAIAHTGFGLAPSLTFLMIARGFAGLFGGNISTAMAYIADITESKDRSKGMGLIGAAFGMGFLLGPFIGGISAHWMENPSAPAFVAGAICFVNFLLAIRYLPESLKRIETASEKKSRFKKIFAAFKTPVLGTMIFLVFVNTVAMALIEASLFLFVQEKFQWTLAEASWGFAYIGLILVFTQGYLIRKWMPKYGERNLLFVGLVLSAAAFFVMGMANTIPLMAVAVTLLGLGNGLATPSLNGSVSLLSGAEVQGNNIGVSQSLSAIARIIGPAAGGYLYQIDQPLPFKMAAAVVLIAFSLALTQYAKFPDGGKQA